MCWLGIGATAGMVESSRAVGRRAARLLWVKIQSLFQESHIEMKNISAEILGLCSLKQTYFPNGSTVSLVHIINETVTEGLSPF